MAGKTPAEKMLLRSGRKVRFVNAPENVVTLLGGLPEGVVMVDQTAPAEAMLEADAVVLFAHSRAELETLLPGIRAALAPGAMVWVLYHKGTSKVKTDIHRDTINAYAQTLGLIGVMMISVDDDWSALRLKVME